MSSRRTLVVLCPQLAETEKNRSWLQKSEQLGIVWARADQNNDSTHGCEFRNRPKEWYASAFQIGLRVACHCFHSSNRSCWLAPYSIEAWVISREFKIHANTNWIWLKGAQDCKYFVYITDQFFWSPRDLQIPCALHRNKNIPVWPDLKQVIVFMRCGGVQWLACCFPQSNIF